MSRKAITQREAHALRRRVKLLEDLEGRRRNEWVRNYPGGKHIASVILPEVEVSKIRTARRLEHAVVASVINGNEVLFYALPISSEGKG